METRARRAVYGGLVVIAMLFVLLPPVTSTSASAATGGTLVLYDTTGNWGFLGEQYGMMAANLASHFGAWAARPVSTYKKGEMGSYAGIIYVGSTYDEPLPAPFIEDVLAGTRPVIWLNDNIWQLTAKSPNFQATYGWMWSGFDTTSVGEVDYKGKVLTRYAANQSGILNVSVSDPTKASVLATAKRADGSSFPWATRSKNLTYIGEIPLAYVDESDRYLAFSDLLFDALAPSTAQRHRGLVRIEDVGPDSDPQALRQIADYLASQQVPFSVATYSYYLDPNGTYNNAVAAARHLSDTPDLVAALKYMQSKGGTILMHGWTHQYSNVANPYDGASADDFEFWRAHVDQTNSVILDGPVAEDSAAWAGGRMDSAANEFAAVGIAKPTIFEFPHYAASPIDYEAARTRFNARYERSLYFSGQLAGKPDSSKFVGQFFPYVVNKDAYGAKVLPENLGNEEPEPFNNHPARLPADIVNNAEKNLVIRDGFASFFWHSYLPLADLQTIVSGIKNLGYSFVSPTQL